MESLFNFVETPVESIPEVKSVEIRKELEVDCGPFFRWSSLSELASGLPPHARSSTARINCGSSDACSRTMPNKSPKLSPKM
jgi:hypothetical protein